MTTCPKAKINPRDLNYCLAIVKSINKLTVPDCKTLAKQDDSQGRQCQAVLKVVKKHGIKDEKGCKKVYPASLPRPQPRWDLMYNSGNKMSLCYRICDSDPNTNPEYKIPLVNSKDLSWKMEAIAARDSNIMPDMEGNISVLHDSWLYKPNHSVKKQAGYSNFSVFTVPYKAKTLDYKTARTSCEEVFNVARMKTIKHFTFPELVCNLPKKKCVCFSYDLFGGTSTLKETFYLAEWDGKTLTGGQKSVKSSISQKYYLGLSGYQYPVDKAHPPKVTNPKVHKSADTEALFDKMLGITTWYNVKLKHKKATPPQTNAPKATKVPQQQFATHY